MGVLTGNWSKWWGRYLRNTVGIKDRRKVFHSFRHTFKDACREARIPQEAHDALTGHSEGTNQGSNYGSGQYPLSALTAAIADVCYAGLELPRVERQAP